MCVRVQNIPTAPLDRRYAINTTPYRLAFDRHMVVDGASYKLLRNLQLLEVRTVQFDKEGLFDIIRKRTKDTTSPKVLL